MLETCVQMYKRMPTGLSAELVYFNQGPSAHVQEDITVRVSFLTTCKWCYASLILCYAFHLTSGAILGTHYSHNLWKVLEKLLLVFILSLHLLSQIFLVVMRKWILEHRWINKIHKKDLNSPWKKSYICINPGTPFLALDRIMALCSWAR